MKNSSPRNNLKDTLILEEKKRKKELLMLGDKLLMKIHKFLFEIKRGGCNVYKIKSNDIRGFSSIDISVIYHKINSIYRDTPWEYKNLNKYELLKDSKGKSSVVFNGNPLLSPVFFFSGVENSEETSSKTERTYMEGPLIDLAINEIEEILNNKQRKNNKYRIIGLKKPIKWEDITIIYCGETIKIKQNDTSLGEHDLVDLGFPKIGIKKMEGVRQFFTSLLFINDIKNNNILSSKNNNQQKLKSNLSKILKDAFETNINPIQIDKKNHKYNPVFKVSMGKDLNINDFFSGRGLRDDDLYHTDLNSD